MGHAQVRAGQEASPPAQAGPSAAQPRPLPLPRPLPPLEPQQQRPAGSPPEGSPPEDPSAAERAQGTKLYQAGDWQVGLPSHVEGTLAARAFHGYFLVQA